LILLLKIVRCHVFLQNPEQGGSIRELGCDGSPILGYQSLEIRLDLILGLEGLPERAGPRLLYTTRNGSIAHLTIPRTRGGSPIEAHTGNCEGLGLAIEPTGMRELLEVLLYTVLEMPKQHLPELVANSCFGLHKSSYSIRQRIFSNLAWPSRFTIR
jgi:hypothetical protein